MQLNDDELDKKLEELEKQRKTLYETASKTNKITEKEKYKKIKEELKINQQNIVLFIIEKEKRESERKLTKVPSQVKEIDYDTKIKQLKKKRKELLETANKTDKTVEKEKYKKIKEDLNQNKIDISLLEESRQKEEQQKEEQQKEEQQKEEPQKEEQQKEEQQKEEINYDAQLEQLETQQKALYKESKKTDKKEEKDKYRKIKEEIKQNQQNIILLILEKEKQDKEKEEKERGKKEENVKHVLMQLQLGDVIRLNNPTNNTLNGYIFFINYIDDSKMKLINLSSMTTIELKINKDKTIEDDTIDVISLLFRNKTPSYARQNKLLPGTWLNVLFEGNLPKIETGEITNIEQDMIEIKLFPSNNIIFLNFEYKGMIDNVTLEIRDKIVKDQEEEEKGEEKE